MLSNFVNSLLDNLIATGSRLLDVPLFMLLAAIAVVCGALMLMMLRFPRLRSGGRFAIATLAVLGAAYIMDCKITRLEDQVSQLRVRMTSDAIAQSKSTPKPIEKRQAFLFDMEAAQKALTAQFHDVNVRPTIYDEAIDVAQVKINGWPAQVYLAVIDLKNPAVQIRLGAGLEDKTLTSAFAKQNDCAVAINGEAGQSPGPRAGLGPWRGYMIDQGKVILQEEPGNPRPFLSFDKQNRATFVPMSSSDRAVGAQAYNVIWGRFDAIVDGQLPDADNGDRQPRTAMAINQDGSRLYLMVVDGRQPRYSIGFTRSEVGKFLQAFGGYNGMLCDEGGSSCIYLKQFGGISNIPSDGQGQERPTYTHFGISVKL